jgi:hypothetical protein
MYSLDPLKPEFYPDSIYKFNLFPIWKQVSVAKIGQLKVFRVKSLFVLGLMNHTNLGQNAGFYGD